MNRGFLRAAVVFIVTLFLPSPGFPGTFVGFGPQNYTRGTASPVVVTNGFTVLNSSTSYTLKIDNGGLVGGQVSSAVISLNGVQIVGPNEFNQNVTLIERPITLAASNQLSVELRGKLGGGITIQIIGVDNDPPTIAASVNPAPNAAGWHKADATVSFTCSDATSGIASCPNPMSVSTEGANQVVSGTAVDRAGNTASTSVTLNIDKTPPTLSPTITPHPNLAGWNNSDITASFTCSDSASGVASCPGPVTVSTEGANQLISGTATDLAGNSVSTSVSISLDKTAPTVAITSPSSGATVSSSPVNVTGTASDSLSGIATVLCNGNPATLSTSTFSCDVPLTNGPNTITVEATDIASNKRSSTITVTLGEPLQPQSPPVVFGPRIFTLPNEAVSFLVTNPVGTFWLQVFNGQDGLNLVDSGSIFLNGVQVGGPQDFIQDKFGFQKDVTLQTLNTLEVQLNSVPGSFITFQIRVAEPNVTVSNQTADLSGINEGHAVGLVWSDDKRAAEYVVFRADSIQGPWQELFRTPGDRPNFMDFTADARLMDLCYKVEARDTAGLTIRLYEPICVPKFVEAQTQSFNLQRSLPARENTIARTVIRDDPVRLASLNPLAIAANIYLLPERTAQAKNAEPNPGVPNSAGDLVGRNIGTSTYLGWTEAEGAIEYRVFKSTSVNGPWTEMGRSARTGADDISPSVRTMDLCYKVEAPDALGNMVRSYEPVCVPKFVEPQTQGFVPRSSSPIKKAALSPTPESVQQTLRNLAPFGSLRASVADLASTNNDICTVPGSILKTEIREAEPNVTVSNQRGDLSGIDLNDASGAVTGSFLGVQAGDDAKLNPQVSNEKVDLSGQNAGDSIDLWWGPDERATEYVVFRADSMKGPWKELFRRQPWYRGNGVDHTLDATRRDLCYRVDAVDAGKEIVRHFEPICVPRFVKPQTQGFNQGGVQQASRSFSGMGFAKASATAASSDMANEFSIIPGHFLTVQIREAERNVTVSNHNADLSGVNEGDGVGLAWSDDEKASEYIIYRAFSLDGPWEAIFRSSKDRPTNGIDLTPEARLRDLCYRIEVVDVGGRVVRRYEPICVPKFVEPGKRSLNPEKFPAISEATRTRWVQGQSRYSLQLASLSLMADAPDPRINELCFANPDPEFTDWQSRGPDESGIQRFLESRGSFLQRRIDDVDPNKTPIVPAKVIFEAAQQFQINPEVLLAILQREQKAITAGTRLDDRRLRRLMGWDRADQFVPLANKSIQQQIFAAAKQLRDDLNRLNSGTTTIGGWKKDLEKMTTDSVLVTPANKPAAVMYSYNPEVGQLWGGGRGVGGNSRFCDWWEQFGFKRQPVTISPQNPTLVCGPDASVTFTASGGRPGPDGYSWSVSNSNARVTVAGVNKENMELRPPANTGLGVDGIAYDRHWQGKGKAFNNETCVDAVNSACCDSYKCDDSVNDPNGCPQHGWPGPWWTCIFIASDANRVNCIGLPQCFENTGLFTTCKSRIDVSTGGVIHDVRLQAMKDAGCRPCAPEMQGVTVTVTDAAGATAPTTVGAQ